VRCIRQRVCPDAGIQKQEIKKETKEVGHDIKEGAEKVGNKTAEIASKGASKVVDKTYKDKMGPDGQTIYIDGHSKYYWINSKGEKVYIAASRLKDKK
jgi:hypothetical protein